MIPNIKTAAIGVLAASSIALGGLLLHQRTQTANERAEHMRTKAAHAETLGRLSSKTNELLADLIRLQGLISAAEQERDRKFSQELEHELAEDRRRRGPATRVRIAATCPTAPTGSPDLSGLSGAGSLEPPRAEIVGADRQRVLDLVGAVKTEDVQLRYLQEYAQACAAGLPPPAEPKGAQ